jgi:ABC-2 type transport system permease protein
MAIAADLLSNIAAVSAVFLLAWRFNGVGGMSRWDVLFMLGYVTCVTGFYQLFFTGCNTGHISRRIGRGQVDHMLVQPLPLPVQLATEGFIPFTGSQNLLFGTGIIVWALRGMGRQTGLLWLLGFGGYLFVSAAIIVGLSYLFSSLAFRWQVAFEEISSTVVDDLTGVLSNYPLSGMPLPVQWTLITVVPAGLLGWFPACALLGKTPLGLSVLYPLVVAVVVWALAALAFRKGLKYYVQIGSNRYSPGGHRR